MIKKQISIINIICNKLNQYSIIISVNKLFICDKEINF